MTVAATTRKAGPYAGNGVTTIFPFAFKVFSRADVAVILTDSIGNASTLVLDSDYSVLLNPDQDAAPGGSITYPILVGPTPLPTGQTLTMIGALPYDQGTDITNAGRFLPQVIENSLDKVTILTQQLKEISGRTLQAAVGTNVALVFPAPSSGKFIRWRSDLTGLENADAGTDSMVLQGLLADAALANRGAGMIGFNPALAYPASTVGASLRSVADILSTTDATKGAALVGYKINKTGGVGRTLANKLLEHISAKDFGAVGDGVTDDSAAINAAIAAAQPLGTVFIPAGTYKIGAATIGLGGSGVNLVGAGIGSTILKASVAALPIITLTAGSNRLRVSDLTVDSSVVRTPGGYGIYSPGVVSNCTIENVQATNQYNGFQLGATDSSILRHCFAQRNYNSGIVIATVNAASGGGCQWTLQNIVSELNDAHGIDIEAAPYVGVAQMTLGCMMDVNLFGNTGYGCVVIGQAGCPVFGFRVNGMFSGQNGKESLYLNSYGNQHNINNFYVELDGSSATGRTFSTPATHTARGMVLTANNKSMQMSNGLVKSADLGGIINSCSERLVMNGVVVEDSGQFAPNVGIYHQTATGRLIMSGCTSGNTGAGASQTYGLFADDLGLVAVSGYDFTNNSVGAVGGSNLNGLNAVCGFPVSFGNRLAGGVVLAGATGDNKGVGTLNAAGTIYRANTAYNNP